MNFTSISSNGIAMQNIFQKRTHHGSLKRAVKNSDKTELLRRQPVKKWRGRWKLPSLSFRFLAMPTVKIAAAGCLIALILFVGVCISLSQQPARMMNEIALPHEADTIENKLLTYVNPEVDAQGSGDINLSELPIVRSVHTRSYEVRPGDTLSEISADHGIDVGTLISFNKIDDVRRLMAGTTIMIPDLDGVPYTVKVGDSLDRIALEYEVSLESILDANDLQSAVIQPGQKLFIPGASISEYDYRKAMGTLFVYPVYGRITSGYGYRNDPFTGVRRMHYGIDLANQIGSPVRASMEGTVAAIGNQPNGYGRYVVLKHRHGFQTLYGHLSTVSVRLNQYVRQGQKLGELGNSGRSTGPHLHFSLYKNNIPINPLGGYLYK
ncbi:MAG: peptidoglycan DD-metalloendopeptidase family protein [Sediminispirochaetaceae bacterium]